MPPPPPNTSLGKILLPGMMQTHHSNLLAASAEAAHAWNYRILWPLNYNRIRPGVRPVSNTFGAGVRTDEHGKPVDHQGWDLLADIGTPCYSIARGRVEFTQDAPSGAYGRQVCIAFQAKIRGYQQTTFY